MLSRTKLIAGMAVALALVGFGSISAMALPGPAPTIPAGFQLFMPSCSHFETTAGQLYSVSDVTGAATKVGTLNSAAATDQCPNAAAYDPADGKFYVLEQDEALTVTTLYSVDTLTGVYTSVGTSTDVLYNLMIDNEGHAFTSIAGVMYSLSLTDASTALIGGSNINNSYCVAVNPATDAITTIDYNTGEISTINKTSGAVTTTGVSLSYPVGKNCYALAFDSNGIAWMGDTSSPYLLFAGNLTTGVTWSIGNVVDGSTNLAMTALMVGLPTKAVVPELPNTGMNTTSTAAFAGFGGFLALAGVLTLTAIRRRKGLRA